MYAFDLFPVRAAILAAATTLCLACKPRTEEPEPAPGASATVSPPAAAKAAAQRHSENPEDVPKDKLVSVGQKVESSYYYLTLKEVRVCSAPSGANEGEGEIKAAGGQPSEPPKAKPASPKQSATLVLGALVEIESKVGTLFVSPRDMRLKTGGVIFQSQQLTEAPKGCGPLLKPHNLALGTRAKGTVVFKLPKARAKDLLLDYRPTRWGGAGRVGVKIPPLEPLSAHAAK